MLCCAASQTNARDSLQGCTSCMNMTELHPRLWTTGTYFLCPDCSAKETHRAPVTCLRCNTSGVAKSGKKGKRGVLAEWAQRSIPYIDDSGSGETRYGHICDGRSCNHRVWVELAGAGEPPRLSQMMTSEGSLGIHYESGRPVIHQRSTAIDRVLRGRRTAAFVEPKKLRKRPNPNSLMERTKRARLGLIKK